MSDVQSRPRGGSLRGFARCFAAVAFTFFGASSADATLLSSVQASDGVDNKILSQSNIGRSVAVAPDGTIYVAYISGDGLQLRVARSTDRGATFQPSVAAVTYATGSITNINLAVASSGYVYAVAVAADGSVALGYSFDGGQIFTQAGMGTAGNNEVGVATDGSYVYVAVTGGAGGVDVHSSTDGGLTFPAVANAAVPASAFWHLNVDANTGNVVVSSDTPSVFVSVSIDHAATFGPVQNPAGTEFYSSTAVSGGPLGDFLFFGSSTALPGGEGVRINLGDFSSTPLPNLTLTGDAQSESLVADSSGNLVVGYVNGSGNVAFEVSNDLGANFGPEVSVAGASRDTVEISAYGDVLFAYLLGGQVYVDTHCGLVGPCVTFTVTDGNPYARYGHAANYLVTAKNIGTVPAPGALIAGSFSAALDSASASWSCVAGPNSACGQSGGSGGFASGFDLGVGDTVSWVVSVPILQNAADPTATFGVGKAGLVTASSDVDTLVLFRDSFDVANGNGTNAPTP